MTNKTTRKQRLRFKCPSCSGDELYCVNRGCTNKTRILDIDDDDCFVVEPAHTGFGDRESYACAGCDFVLQVAPGVAVSNHVELLDWLKFHGMLEKGIFVNVGDVDWKLLRKQKQELLAITVNEDDLNGIIHLIDHIQDEAVQALGEREVFGG